MAHDDRRRLRRGGRRPERGRRRFRPPGVTSLEGLLFPDTYQVSNGESEAQVIERMIALMERVGQPGGHRRQGRERSARRPYGILTIASMIEREAKTRRGPAEDRPGDLQPARHRHAAGRSTPRVRYGTQQAGSTRTRSRSASSARPPGRTTRTSTPGCRRRRSPTPAGRRSRPPSTRRRTRASATRCAPTCPTDVDVPVPVLRARQRGRRPRLRRRPASSTRPTSTRPRAAGLLD